MSHFDSLEQLPHARASIHFEKILKLDALIHVEDPLFVALVERLNLGLLFHLVDLSVALGQDLVGKIKLCLQLDNDIQSALAKSIALLDRVSIV